MGLVRTASSRPHRRSADRRGHQLISGSRLGEVSFWTIFQGLGCYTLPRVLMAPMRASQVLAQGVGAPNDWGTSDERHGCVCTRGVLVETSALIGFPST